MPAARTPLEVITQATEALPVVRAWCAIDASHAIPRRVELLRRKRKSLVYRLVGVGVGGSDVIAKACAPETAFVERTVYADVLPRLPVTQLGYYGFAESAGAEFSWLFLEDARGAEFAPDNPEHRELATRWLATLHVASGSLAPPPPVPERGTAHYRDHMRQARAAITENYENPAFGKDEHQTLDRILTLFAFAESKWPEIEALCNGMPHALIHADFAERNVQIRPAVDGTAGATLVAFDWEVAGWGPPVVDLAHADLQLYWSLVRDHWCCLEFGTLRRLIHVGGLLRGGIAATNWSAPSLTTPWPEKAIRNMKVYDRRMTAAIRGLGWAT